IGAGYDPRNTQYNLKTQLGNVNFNRSNSTTLATGSILKGLHIAHLTYAGGTTTFDVNNILVERCRMSSLTACGSNWVIKNNKVDNLYLEYKSNLIVANNFIGSSIRQSDKPSVLITNNILIEGVFFS